MYLKAFYHRSPDDKTLILAEDIFMGYLAFASLSRLPMSLISLRIILIIVLPITDKDGRYRLVIMGKNMVKHGNYIKDSSILV